MDPLPSYTYDWLPGMSIKIKPPPAPGFSAEMSRNGYRQKVSLGDRNVLVQCIGSDNRTTVVSKFESEIFLDM